MERFYNFNVSINAIVEYAIFVHLKVGIRWHYLAESSATFSSQNAPEILERVRCQACLMVLGEPN
jgi:hypothetical protein